MVLLKRISKKINQEILALNKNYDLRVLALAEDNKLK